MKALLEQDVSANCWSEYDKLEKVIVCEPTYMAIDEVINDVQKKYEDENIDQKIAQSQHEQFRKTLEKNGVEVITLPASQEYPEQVFTRDIGFTLGEKLFVAEMASEIREGEEEVLTYWLDRTETDYETLDVNKIEGGDVIIDRNVIYVGVSGRTSLEAIRKLQAKLPHQTVIPVKFDAKYLHLDCVFNVLSPEVAIIYPDAIDPKMVKLLSEKYTLIEVCKDEQFTMGTNVLSIGDKKVLSLPINKKVNKAMREKGFDVLEVDFSEIIKSGGSFRCCSMPVEREK